MKYKHSDKRKRLLNTLWVRIGRGYDKSKKRKQTKRRMNYDLKKKKKGNNRQKKKFQFL